MALDVIAALSASPAISAVHVICGDGWAQLEELPAPVRVWREPDEHNGGLVGALEWVAGQVNSDALFVHGDLPFVDASDSRHWRRRLHRIRGMSPIARRRDERAAAMADSEPAAGIWREQLRKTLAAIASAGLYFREVSTMGLAMDIDAPGDLSYYRPVARLGTYTAGWWQRYGGSLFKDATQKVL